MKTLRDIRENYENRLIPKQIMLEADKKVKDSKLIPSSKEMPPLLLFRRITYKLYPNKQVIALYYARSIDKYLSVPFGPGGNVNLHEARIIEPDQLNEFGPLAGAAIGAGIDLIKGMLGPKEQEVTTKQKLGAYDPKIKPKLKTSRGIITKQPPNTTSNAVDTAKLKGYEKSLMKQPQKVQENKMYDLRKMVREGVSTKDLTINGRTITINTSIAKRILEVYDSVNPKNKKIMESMLNEDLATFKKLLNFSVKA